MHATTVRTHVSERALIRINRFGAVCSTVGPHGSNGNAPGAPSAGVLRLSMLIHPATSALPGAWSSPLPSEACTGELTVALRGELAEAAARLSLSPCAAAGRHAAASSVDDDGCEAAARRLVGCPASGAECAPSSVAARGAAPAVGAVAGCVCVCVLLTLVGDSSGDAASSFGGVSPRLEGPSSAMG